MQKQLRIERTVSWETVAAISALLAGCPDGPTYAVQRGEDGQAHMFFSKRTYDYLEQQLRNLKLEGKI